MNELKNQWLYYIEYLLIKKVLNIYMYYY